MAFFTKLSEHLISVPLDLDVKVKAIMIGAVFLIVSKILNFLGFSLVIAIISVIRVL